MQGRRNMFHLRRVKKISRGVRRRFPVENFEIRNLRIAIYGILEWEFPEF